MSTINARVVHVSMCDLGFVTDAKGREWTFKYHEYCGVTVLRADGEQLKRQPGRRSPFWPALQVWLDERRAHAFVSSIGDQ
ncbi:hypothetical protein CDN99_06585 [Roseateles aquatilis]|uniref:Uncharacterized protein n=1 Tax=Roseateles aquatilis TaxID=431061 RepID=A0A246JID9_9BURK|nr:hypothetical protein [Roseateles aquatilis]OWQ92019.1 hypothetical protein CDN99_06585 [Roseateles aquatilis]